MNATHPRTKSPPLPVSLVPQDATIVLQVAWAGHGLKAEYLARNPGARFVGCTPSELSGPADAAEQPEGIGLEVDTADVVLLPHVLEQVSDPWALLQAALRFLSDEGVLVASVTNVRHWANLRGLLAGDWRPGEAVSGRRAPLRFFDRRSLLGLLRRAGLNQVELHPHVPERAEGERFLKALAPAAETLGLDLAQLKRDALPQSYTARAVRRARRKLFVQAVTLRPQGACNDVRIHEPLAALASRPEVLVRVERETARMAPPSEALDRLFIWQRPIFKPEHLASVQRLIARGYVVVTEFDDHPMRWPAIAEHDHLGFRAVHAVQTSTPALASLFREMNDEVAIFANAISSLPPAPEPGTESDPLHLFFGALNREEDWAPMLGPLNAVLRRHPGRFHVEVIHDRGFFDALDTDAKSFTPTCGYGVYKAILGRSDVALMPLEDSVFNRMKSDLKFVEAAAHGAVALASPTVYGESIRDGETGFICATPEAFGARLEELLNAPERRLEVARAAWRWVRDKRMLSSQIGDRLAWYRSLIERRDHLTEAACRRVPELSAWSKIQT